MSAVAQQGESVGRPGAFPVHPVLARIAWGCVLLLGLLWRPAAHAGALYRCTGSRGEAVFSSSVAGYTGCRRLGSYGSAGRAPTHAAPRPAGRPPSWLGVHGWVQTTARQVSLGAVVGGAQTTARPLAPGQWSYRDGVTSPDPPPARDPGRVLRGAVYRVVKADGSVEYTNLTPGSGGGRAITRLFTYIATCAACDLHSTIDWGRVRLHLDAYVDAIRAASAESGVDPAFLRAVIHAESAFNPNALSLKGAQGLMQLMPGTASDMGVLDAFNAEQNIRGGARYLAQLLRTFGGNEQLAAAAYNAGPGAVQRYRGVPPFAETQVYVRRVAELRKRYGAAVHGTLASAQVPAGAP